MSLRLPRHVLSVAYPFAPVGPRAVGGAEQVLTTLEEQLAARGIRSTVIACEGSSVAGTLVPTQLPGDLITDAVRDEVTAAHQRGIDRALAFGVDLVHMHGIDFHRYRIPAHVPVLVTLHMPPSWYPDIWHLPPHYRLQCVSEPQRASCPAYMRERIAVVGNGVPPAPAYKGKQHGFALLLARICPEKNLHAGLHAGRAAGVRVLLAGETFPYEEHLRYFAEQIEPRLGGHARLLGPVGGERKQRLLAAARCLLLPTLAPETSSLTAMEAMMAGTPVIAYRSGALPGIVEHGRTGFLVNDADEMAEAIRHINDIDPEACRAAAAERFSAARMVERYLALYVDILRPARAA